MKKNFSFTGIKKISFQMNIQARISESAKLLLSDEGKKKIILVKRASLTLMVSILTGKFLRMGTKCKT